MACAVGGLRAWPLWGGGFAVEFSVLPGIVLALAVVVWGWVKFGCVTFFF